MKFILLTILAGVCANAQSTFVYDQQSSTDEATIAGNATIQQLVAPYGQSFTPTLTAIDFVRLKLNDRNPGNGVGATLYVNLRTTSIGGTILGSTMLVSLSDGFAGVTNFFFASSMPLTPGVTYFFQPVVQSGPGNDLWNLDAEEFNYPGGTAFYQGSPLPSSDYWFREGIVPEPSSALLALVGGGALVWLRRRIRCR